MTSIMISPTTLSLTTFLLSTFIAIYFRKRSNQSYNDSTVSVASIGQLQGPPSPSWLAGHFSTFLKSENAEDEHKSLIGRFGLACKLKFFYNRDILYLADPKGLQYVLNTSGYNFHKREGARLSRLFLGNNILAVEGDEHARQRRMLLPSFSQSHMHEIVPAFTQVTSKAVEQWKDLVTAKQGKGIDVDLYVWLSRLTLDALGQAVLSHDFGALTDKPSEYGEAFRGLFVDMFKDRTNFELVMQALLGRLPDFIGRSLLNLSVKGMNRFEKFMAISSELCTSIILREKEAVGLGKPPSKDLLSTLVRANMNLDPKNQVSDDEMLSQMNAFAIAGHDTVSSMLQWVFYELSRHPEAQAKIREEIRSVKEAKGVQELGPSELESLHYTTAVLKETLRFDPIATLTTRRAERDDIIPLAYPVKTASGKEVHAIHVKRGQQVLVSFYGYNFIKDLWGPDADVWNPDRFLRENETERSRRTLGVYAHLATFSSGVHACIGWRFALLEMLAIMTGLLEHFEFAPTASNPTILKKVATTVYPSVKGDDDRKAQMPLFIRPVS